MARTQNIGSGSNIAQNRDMWVLFTRLMAGAALAVALVLILMAIFLL
jgi:hypothetical protein